MIYIKKESLTYTEIYQNFLNKMIEYAIKNNNNTKEEYQRELQKSNRLIKIDI